MKHFDDDKIGDVDFGIEEAAPMTEQELQEREAEARKRDEIRGAAAIREYTEKHLACPKWFVLEKWRAPEKAYGVLGDFTADIFSSINEMAIGRSGIIIGPTNTGKSHLACAIARASGKRSMRIKDFAFAPLCEVHKYRRSDEFQEMLDEATKCDLLILDDFGKNECQRGDGPTYYGNIILGIVDARAENHRQTIATTRYCNGALLEDRVSEDLIRRINQVEGDKKTHVMIFLGG